MNIFQSCSDTSDAVPLSTSQGLYLKPVAKLNISVQLPSLKTPGKSISNWEVMEKLRHYAVPEEFITLKVSKSTLEVVRFEGEIENHSKLPAVLARLDGRSIKLSGFHETLKVRAAEAKPDFPSRHAWDSYFRDAKNMNEMKPGERPDTMHITNLPCKWFSAKSDVSKPSEYILRKVFELFGEVRCVDIPMLDPFRSQMKSHISGVKMFSNNQNMIFEAYIQFREYICFVKAMDTLRGMKLLHKEADGKAFSASIKVDFDKTKHLSDSNLRRRRVERERLMAKEREREEKERQAKEEEEKKLAAERKRIEEEKAAKLERQRQREERRKAKQLERLKRKEADEMNQKIATEERLLLIAQRRLESYRLLGELFNRLKMAKEIELQKNKDNITSGRNKYQHKNQKDEKVDKRLESKEKELREKLVKKFKHSDQIGSVKGNQHLSQHKHANEPELSCSEDENPGDHFDDGRGFQRGHNRRWFPRRRRGNNIPFRGNQFQPLPFQPFANRGFFPHRGYARWPRFPLRGREGNPDFIPPPFIDPYYLDSAINDQYYKYFHKITLGDRKSSSRSRSRTRSRSRSRYRSRSRSRSYSRSYSRSSSFSRSPSRRSRSRSKRHSRPLSRGRTRSRSKSRSQRSKLLKKRNRTKSCSSRHSLIDEAKEKNLEKIKLSLNAEIEQNKPLKKSSSVHTWSRSPSRTRSLSWERKKDEPSLSSNKQEPPLSPNKHHFKHKKERKIKEKKKKRNKKTE